MGITVNMAEITTQIAILVREADELYERYKYEVAKPSTISDEINYLSLIQKNLDKQAQLRNELDHGDLVSYQNEESETTSKNLSIFGEKFIQPDDIPKNFKGTELYVSDTCDTGRETPV